MNREQILESLKALAKEAEKNPDTLAAAGVLYCLCGAMKQGKELEMMQHIVPFNQKQIDELTMFQSSKN